MTQHNNKRTRKYNKRINIILDDDTYEQIKSISDKTHQSMNEICRQYIYTGLSGKICEDNLNLITMVLREQLQIQLKPAVERICGLTAKTGIMAASSFYTNAETLSSLLPDNKKQDFQEIYEKARKKGVTYMRSKPSDDEKI